MNDTGVYQFMTHSYDGSNQNASTVAAVVKGTFMETRNPGGGYSNYASLINAVGKASNVNPNVLAAMIVQEQGSKGTSSLISGTVSGYKGYYNFFNVNAYETPSHNKITNGSDLCQEPWMEQRIQLYQRRCGFLLQRLRIQKAEYILSEEVQRK